MPTPQAHHRPRHMLLHADQIPRSKVGAAICGHHLEPTGHHQDHRPASFLGVLAYSVRDGRGNGLIDDAAACPRFFVKKLNRLLDSRILETTTY